MPCHAGGQAFPNGCLVRRDCKVRCNRIDLQCWTSSAHILLNTGRTGKTRPPSLASPSGITFDAFSILHLVISACVAGLVRMLALSITTCSAEPRHCTTRSFLKRLRSLLERAQVSGRTSKQVPHGSQTVGRAEAGMTNGPASTPTVLSLTVSTHMHSALYFHICRRLFWGQEADVF